MRDNRPRAAVRLTFANPVSLVYLTVVASLPLLVSPWTEGQAFADVWLAMATAPSSLLLLLPDAMTGLSGWATAYHYTALVLSAVINAFLLGLAYRALRRNPARQGLTA
ncbi:SCO4225 family membrane protein [Streptomyces gardneri]|uniref:SCO4225 family membrane protein n=1 Tax=Streptomyces gardneri TaxID=66892 RepID=UPI0036850E7A